MPEITPTLAQDGYGLTTLYLDTEYYLATALAYPVWRFDPVAVPQGAVVSSAYITLTLYAEWEAAHAVEIAAQDVDDAPVLTESTNPSTLDLTTAVCSTIPAAGAPLDERSFDVTAVVQELVDRDGRGSGGAMTFRLRDAYTKGDGYFLTCAMEYASGAYAAELTINFTPPASGSTPPMPHIGVGAGMMM